MLQKNKPTQEDENRAIQVGADFKSLKKTQGWKHLDAFMDKSKEGAVDALNNSTTSLKIWTIPVLFNTFAKFLMVSFEYRAYNKIKQYVNVSIRTADFYAARRATREKQASKK